MYSMYKASMFSEFLLVLNQHLPFDYINFFCSDKNELYFTCDKNLYDILEIFLIRGHQYVYFVKFIIS